MSGGTFKAGEIAYLAHPGEVSRVRVIRYGRDDRNYRYRVPDPIVVEFLDGSDNGFVGEVGKSDLYSSPVAAAIRADELDRLSN